MKVELSDAKLLRYGGSARDTNVVMLSEKSPTAAIKR